MLEDKHYNWQEVEQLVLNQIKATDYTAPISHNNSYSIIMPPPNVTGVLHMGHALVTTLQDVLVRYHRMKGYNVLWQPGLDHAGIATQVIVEKMLEQKGLTKDNLGREKFIEEVYKWKEYSASNIISQITKIGASCDFSYTAFTMDAQSVKGVIQAFVNLYNNGLIYQDNKLVNWDCKLQTAISDLEVEQKEVQSKMYYLKYYLQSNNNDSTQYILVATTRPETIFADVAIAVNPEDKRYKHLVGLKVRVPISNHLVPVITDEYADSEKGTGVVKITPGHDFNDFDVGKRHSLDVINILNKNGTLNTHVPTSYQGLSIIEARKQVVQDLKNIKALEKIENYLTTIPYGDRSGTVVEPFLTKQWFLDVQTMSEKALQAVEKGDTKFIPKNWENLYFDWLKKIKPWCISRQLWWGHRIPIWYTQNNEQICAENEKEALKKAKELYGNNCKLHQDNDVLDTWFSSSLWPLVTLGFWENKDNDRFKQYFPTSVLVTGFDIIFFWVARMMMMSLYFTNKVPFKDIYINALVRDENGQKMSKSKGNVIDPLEMMNKYGTDALRFTLVYYSGHGRDINLSEKTIEGFRNFIAKIWNSYKFCKANGFEYNNTYNPSNIILDINKWILHKLEEIQLSLEDCYDGYRFHDIARGIYDFIWKDFCDCYLELAKSALYSDGISQENKTEIKYTLGYIFDAILKLSHPIIPFITQYLYNNLHSNNSNIALKQINNYKFSFNKEDISNIDRLIILITKVRNIKATFNIPNSSKLSIILSSQKHKEVPKFIVDNMLILTKMLNIIDVSFSHKDINIPSAQDVFDDYTLIIPLQDVVDITAEKNRLTKSIKKIDGELEKLDKKLKNPQFLEKASKPAIEKVQAEHIELNQQKDIYTNILSKLIIKGDS